MWTSLSSLLEFVDRYHGYVVGFGALAAVLLINQLIFRRRWSSYPTREQYLAAYPGCATMDGVVCNACGQRAAGGGVIGAGRIYRCSWCDTELYRVDQNG